MNFWLASGKKEYIVRNKDMFCEKVSRVSFIYDWLEFICILNLSIYHCE